MVRYISDSSLTANESPACIIKNAMHIVKIIGIRQRRNNEPNINPSVHKISAKSTSQRDRVPPNPMGSGNAWGVSP